MSSFESLSLNRCTLFALSPAASPIHTASRPPHMFHFFGNVSRPVGLALWGAALSASAVYWFSSTTTTPVPASTFTDAERAAWNTDRLRELKQRPAK